MTTTTHEPFHFAGGLCVRCLPKCAAAKPAAAALVALLSVTPPGQPFADLQATSVNQGLLGATVIPNRGVAHLMTDTS